MNEKAAKALKYFLSVMVAAALVYFAFRGNDWQTFLEGLRQTNWWYVILSMAVSIAAVVFRASRWRSQLLPLDGDISWKTVWQGSNIGNFLNIVIPGLGEFYRCGHVCTAKATYDRTFGSMIMERSWDVLAILVLIVLAVLTSSDAVGSFMEEHIFGPFSARFSFSIWWIAAAAVLAAAAALILIFAMRTRSRLCNRIAGWTKGMVSGFASFSKIPRKGMFLLYTVGIWVTYILMTLFTFKAIPGLEHLTFTEALFISAIGNIASVIPTPGNIGPYHYLVGLSISTIYMGASGMTATGLLCATISHGSHAVLVIILGLISYVAFSFRKNN